MENSRRPFDRSLSREPGPKKPRLADDIAASGRSSNMRTGYMQRQVPSNSGSGARIQRDRDSDSSDSSRRLSQLQQSPLPHLELVNQYKDALSELTFNSKPIITNLTIIAGENLHAAKAIASTVCNHILEISKEQKLPSLYLLDSIVKNIGRDYIKHFALRLPEVFCKAYRQVDPSIHQGMRHLFGTWRGVFPPEPLNIIQQELGFANSANGPSSRITTLRPDAQTQCPPVHAHSIHVNPKYLEARGSSGDISEVLLNSREAEAPRRPSNKILQGRQGNQIYPVGDEKVSSMRYMDSEYGSSTAHSLIGAGRVKEKFKEHELDRTWYESGSGLAIEKLENEGNGFGIKHGIDHYNENPSLKNPSVVTRDWKNSEEEEYAWDDMKAKTVSHGAAKTNDSFFKNSWTSSADHEKEDFESYQQRPPMLNDKESSICDDFISPRTDFEVSETRVQFKNAMDYDEYPSSLDSSKIGRIPYHSQPRSTLNGSQNPGVSRGIVSRPSDDVTQQRQMHAASPFSMLSDKKQRPPSPSLSARNLTQQTSKLKDPRKAASLRSTVSPDKFFQKSLPLPSREVHQSNAQRQKLQNVHTAPSTIPASQNKKLAAPSSQVRKIEVSELETSIDGRNLMSSSQVSRSGSRSNIGSSSSGHSNPLGVDSPSQSINSNFLTRVKNVIVDVSSVSSSSKEGFQDVGRVEEDNTGSAPVHDASFLHALGEQEIPRAIISPSTQVSSLISSLMERGLISALKSDSHPMVPTTSVSITETLQVTRPEAISSVENEPSSSKVPDEELSDKAFDVFPQPTAEIKNLIGFEFKSDILRNLHPDVLADLFSDQSHKCDTCGTRLKLEASLSKHMEWHASREQNSMDTDSRSWYKCLLDWFNGIGQDVPAESTLDLVEEPDIDSESIEHTVLADESQITCIVCGELFEDFYCQDTNEWMFKEAVYLSIPMAVSSDAGVKPIVHVDCNSEDFIQNLTTLSVSDAKLENDE